MTASTFILAALAASALVAIVWRLASRRRSLPCPIWLRWLVELDNPFTKTNRAAFIVETLSLSPGMVVLDAGCGPGRLTVPLARGVGPSGRVLAVDIQAGMLARAKAKTEAAGLANVEFLNAGLGDGALPRTCFVRALMVTVLGEIPDRQSAFVELFDTLRPGGVLAVVEVIFDPHFQMRDVVTDLAHASGFREAAFLATASPMSLTSRSLLSSPASVVLVNTLIDRKRSRRFADDNLLIGDYKLKNVDGELRLWAEARQTPTPKGQ